MGLQSGHKLCAIVKIDAKRFFQKQGFARRCRCKRIGFANRRWAGKINQIRFADGVTCAIHDF